MNTKKQPSVGDISVHDLDLPIRAKNALKYLNIKTIRDVDLRCDHELLRHPNFGRKTLKELRLVVKAKRAEANDPLPDAEIFKDAVLLASHFRWKAERASEDNRVLNIRVRDQSQTIKQLQNHMADLKKNGVDPKSAVKNETKCQIYLDAMMCAMILAHRSRNTEIFKILSKSISAAETIDQEG